jgi:alpha-galactosidase
VLAVDQDALGRQAMLVSEQGPTITVSPPTDRPGGKPREFVRRQVWAKPLEDGSHAVGLFNLGNDESKVTAMFADLKLAGRQTVRDLWRQRDLGTFEVRFEASVPPHGVVLVKVTASK